MKDPIVLGVTVLKGSLRIGTPLCVYNNDQTKVGTVETIEKNHKALTMANSKTGDIAIKIKESGNLQAGRQFKLEEKGEKGDRLVSVINRYTLDCLKEYFKEDITQEDASLLRDILKPFFDIK